MSQVIDGYPQEMLSVRIRPATSEDAEPIARAYLQSAEHHAAIDPERYHVPDRAAIMERYRTGGQHLRIGPDCITLVAEVGSDVAGFVDARLERPIDLMHRPMLYCYVVEIAVAIECRSQGIGKLLLEAAERWGRANGASFLSLEYNTRNPRAAAFYERLGYEAASVVMSKWL
jgi:ribosomal protein S18 acetylase RimI-like enzyme